ncbi:neocarzinostatin apoprotein domain-containing protein [Paractinoplanes atraurantiacus]|uniref:Neocarzinostatin family protein n=1 Tax=Paractinoplanes atraurantiacus TaxID=1036182 RepID=A0A285KRJ7_9ACTN|nr:neocarzinostatin apoprotein domain-containing protein [Actinoplanes atraurantiacus]SNY75278.1 Neocarzinostatin family protein [Actinoplanes atraurantiacus]
MVRRSLALAAAAGIAMTATVVLVDASPALAAPTLKVSKTTGLKDGEQVTVSGTGFTKNLQQIAIGQCIKDVKGPADCNLSGGSQFTNADGTGKTPTLTLKMSKSFGGHDCAKVACVIAAQILPSSAPEETVNANRAAVAITFTTGGGTATKAPTPTATTKSPSAGSTTTSSSASSSTTAAGGTGGDGSTSGDALAKTGPGLEWATVVLIGGGLLLPGLGLIAVLPARRRRMASFH